MVIIFVANLFVTKLDLKYDLSKNGLYSLTKDSVNIIKDLKDDITIYYMVQTGSEYPQFEEIARKYDSLSDHIKLETKDPVLYPKFAKKYVDDDISQNSFIVVDNTNGRAKYIDSNDMLVQEMDYQTYQSYTTGVDVEAKVTSAIQYVTSEKLPTLYVVEGHGEKSTGTNFSKLMAKQNVDVKTLSTLTQTSIPEDCDILYINTPTSDFNDNELKMIRDYMDAGGKIILTVNYADVDLKNVQSLLDYYGLKMLTGFVVEQDSNMFYPNYPHYLIPKVESHSITSLALDNKIPVMAPISSALVSADNVRSSLKITPLLTTSDKSFNKMDLSATSLDKEDGDVDGPFNVGVVSEDSYNNTTSDLVVYSTDVIFSDDLLADTGNADILSGTVRFLSGDSASVPIASKSIVPERITLSQKKAVTWGVVTVIVIPVVILITGIVIGYRRRKR